MSRSQKPLVFLLYQHDLYLVLCKAPISLYLFDERDETCCCELRSARTEVTRRLEGPDVAPLT